MSVALSAALVLIVVGLSGGTLRLWHAGGFVISPSGTFVVLAGVLLGVIGLLAGLLRIRKSPTLSDIAHPWVWAGGLLLLFVSDWLCQPYTLFQGPLIRGEIALLAAAAFVLLPRMAKSSWRIMPIICGLLLIWSFFQAANGRLLFSDDHAMFLFRLKLLKEHFPSIPFWSPVWNAGIDARDFFATGALNPFFVGAPLLYAFEVEQVYNLLVALISFVLVPGSTYLATRMTGGSPRAAAIAATIALGTSLTWYRWTLKYGTMGFIVSAATLPLTIAFALKFITSDKLSRGEIVAFVIVTTLTLFWSLAGVALLPLALLALPRIVPILRSRTHLLAILLLLGVNLPWMAMMWKVSNVARFISSESTAASHTATSQVSMTESTENAETAVAPPPAKKKSYRHRSGSIDLRKTVKHWQESAAAMNPLILALGVPALLSLTGFLRVSYLGIVCWLLLLGTFGVPLKPQLELDRMVVVAALVLCAPIGRLLSWMIDQSVETTTQRILTATALGFVVVSPLTASAVLHNRSYSQHEYAAPGINILRDKLRELANGGRVFFSGCMLHDLSGGHLAPLALWAETPMIASSYAHNIWMYEQPIPASFLKRSEVGIREYLDAMNATVVVAREEKWRDFFGAHPAEYSEVARLEGLIIYKREGITPSYILDGAATNISQNTSSVTLTPQTSRVVLKFSYFPFLTAPGCTIAPFSFSEDISFIELKDCAIGQEVTIKSISPIKRLVL